MIPVEEAAARLRAAVAPLPPAEVALEEACGRVLAEEIRADRDSPAAPRSAMDGFAVRAADLAVPGTSLRVVGEVRAGERPPARALQPGEAMRIYTGALVPPGADAVVMVELTEEPAEGQVRVRERPQAGQHVRPRAQDRKAGDVVLAPGDPIHAAEVAGLAALGRRRVRVHGLPRIGILSTGDEVVPLEAEPADHQVRNSNAWSLRAQLREQGLAGTDLGIAPDRADALRGALAQGLSHDVLLVTGGVSVGAYDLVERALREEGLTVLFHGVAMRPGKPLLAGRRGGCLVFGLPGNPLSTFATFLVLVAPALRRLAGFSRCEGPRLQATLAAPLKRKPGRTTFHVGRVIPQEAGFRAEPLRSSGSGDVLSLARGNAFLVTEPGPRALPAGTVVEALLWPEFAYR